MLNQVTVSMCCFAKVPWLFPYSSKKFLNFRSSGTRLLIKQFLIEKLFILKETFDMLQQQETLYFGYTNFG